MKHLKHFNEELRPETYIRAGNRLKYYGKNKKGDKLVDYGYEKGHGFYNAHIQDIGSDKPYSGKITNLDRSIVRPYMYCDLYYILV